MRFFASLTSRLVVTAVALVLLVTFLVGVAATLAMHGRLTAQLDEEIAMSARRLTDGPPGGGEYPRQGGYREPGNIRPGALVAVLPDESAPTGVRYGQGFNANTALDPAVLVQLERVPADATIRHVDLPGLDGYRVKAVDVDGGIVVVGLPTVEVDEAVGSLIRYEALLVGLGGVLAAAAALLVVRRQLRPLREVAETAHTVAALPLSSGEINLSERVPEHLTHENTEVGRVGSALNMLLAHVEASLLARQHSEQQVRQFVADASHELRTPLATIVGYVELARTRPDEHHVAAALAKVAEESARMTELVEDLLLLARLDAGRPLASEPVDLTRLLLEAVSDARVLAPGHHWRLELPEASVEVVGDEARLHQVVTNLLTNARKHTPWGTTVTVSATPRGFAVQDDGPGLPPDLVTHAFERFARGDTARERTGGAGLGLALVAAIVTSLGGTVDITSRPGNTRFLVDLVPVGLEPVVGSA
ncbi:MAG: HAMP domain-containing histidine kinase [Nocardioides sp.]|nr:HAMP domain-containing histidine kinase [Nocardioides sp.]